MLPGVSPVPTVAHLPPTPTPQPPATPPPNPDVPDHDTPEVRDSVLADILHQLDLERSARAELEEQLRMERGIRKMGSKENLASSSANKDDMKSKEELLSLIDDIDDFKIGERPWEEPDNVLETRVVQWSTYDALFKKWTSRPPKDVKRGKGGSGDCTLEDLDEGGGGTFSIDDVEPGDGREWVGQWEVDKGRYGCCKDGWVRAETAEDALGLRPGQGKVRCRVLTRVSVKTVPEGASDVAREFLLAIRERESLKAALRKVSAKLVEEVGKCEGMEREVLEGKRAQSELEKTRQELERVKDALEKEKEEARAWRNEKAIDDAMSSGRNSRASSADSTGSASSNFGWTLPRASPSGREYAQITVQDDLKPIIDGGNEDISRLSNFRTTIGANVLGLKTLLRETAKDPNASVNLGGTSKSRGLQVPPSVYKKFVPPPPLPQIVPASKLLKFVVGESPSQLVVVLCSDRGAGACRTAEKHYAKLHKQTNLECTKNGVDPSKHDFRLIVSDNSRQPDPLAKRFNFNVYPMYMMFYGGKLAFIGDKFNGFSTYPDDLKIEIENNVQRARKNLFLPDNFSFLDPRHAEYKDV